MSEINTDQIQVALKSLFAQAATDADFRALCLSDPAAAVNSVGLALPSDAEIKFVEQKVGEPSDELACVLPPFGADPDALQDDQLSEISGGGTFGGTYEDMSVAAGMYEDHQKLMKELQRDLKTFSSMLKRANDVVNGGIIHNLH